MKELKVTKSSLFDRHPSKETLQEAAAIALKKAGFDLSRKIESFEEFDSDYIIFRQEDSAQ